MTPFSPFVVRFEDGSVSDAMTESSARLTASMRGGVVLSVVELIAEARAHRFAETPTALRLSQLNAAERLRRAEAAEDIVRRVHELLDNAERRTETSLSTDHDGYRFQSQFPQAELRAVLAGAA